MSLYDQLADDLCTICLDTIGGEGEEHTQPPPPKSCRGNELVTTHDPAILPCGHVFGHSCIYQWLRRNPTCPQCKKQYSKQQRMRVLHPTPAERERRRSRQTDSAEQGSSSPLRPPPVEEKGDEEDSSMPSEQLKRRLEHQLRIANYQVTQSFEYYYRISALTSRMLQPVLTVGPSWLSTTQPAGSSTGDGDSGRISPRVVHLKKDIFVCCGAFGLKAFGIVNRRMPRTLLTPLGTDALPSSVLASENIKMRSKPPSGSETAMSSSHDIAALVTSSVNDVSVDARTRNLALAPLDGGVTVLRYTITERSSVPTDAAAGSIQPPPPEIFLSVAARLSVGDVGQVHCLAVYVTQDVNRAVEVVAVSRARECVVRIDVRNGTVLQRWHMTIARSLPDFNSVDRVSYWAPSGYVLSSRNSGAAFLVQWPVPSVSYHKSLNCAVEGDTCGIVLPYSAPSTPPALYHTNALWSFFLSTADIQEENVVPQPTSHRVTVWISSVDTKVFGSTVPLSVDAADAVAPGKRRREDALSSADTPILPTPTTVAPVVDTKSEGRPAVVLPADDDVVLVNTSKRDSSRSGGVGSSPQLLRSGDRSGTPKVFVVADHTTQTTYIHHTLVSSGACGVVEADCTDCVVGDRYLVLVCDACLHVVAV